MSIFRKILCIAALVATAITALGTPQAGARAQAPELARVALSQAGESLIATIRTARPVPLAALDPQPNVRDEASAYLCLELRRRGSGGGRRLCLGGSSAHRRVGLELLNAGGRTTARRMVGARVRRPSSRKLVLSLLPGAAGLTPHRYEWRARVSRGGHCGRPPAACAQSLPARGSLHFRLRPVRAVGCTGAASVLDRNGPRNRNVVALTFDDGPSDYTPAFLDVLRQKHVDGTFFEIGQEMPGREETMRRILSEGSEIGNHTMHHAFFPGYAEIAGASALIESATHFRPEIGNHTMHHAFFPGYSEIAGASALIESSTHFRPASSARPAAASTPL